MGAAIGQILSLAVGVALSPIPIIAVTLMLVSRRARTNGPLFIVGWVVGLAVVGAIVMVIAPGASSSGEPSHTSGVIKLVLGGLLVLAAVRRWRERPKLDEHAEPDMPKWMGTIDDFTPVKSLGAGAALAAVNPKNLLLAVAAASSIAQTKIPGAEQAVAYGVFTIIATIGVVAPVVIYFGMGDKAPPLLDKLKRWMGLHNTAIMVVILLVIGVKLIGDGITVLSA